MIKNIIALLTLLFFVSCMSEPKKELPTNAVYDIPLAEDKSIRDSSAITDHEKPVEPQVKKNVTQDSENLKIIVINFDSGRSVFRQDSYELLNKAISLYNQNNITAIHIDGYSNGQNLNNLGISQNRAAAVRNYLIENRINADVIFAAGYGENTPNEIATEIRSGDCAVIKLRVAPADNNTFNYNYDQAITSLMDGNSNNALVSINKAIDQNPNNADSYYIKGNILQRQNLIDEAIGSYLKALDLNPNHIDSMLKCGIIYGKRNDKTTAFIYFERACKLGSNEACTILKKFR